MDFSLLSINAVKSISQISLLRCWDHAANGRPFPSLEEFRPDERTHDPKQLVFWRVEQLGPRECRFHALYQGRHIAHAFGEKWAGQSMDAVVPPFARELAILTSTECVASGCPIYIVVRTADANGRDVELERLLLPFGTNGRIEQLVASLQLVSLQGEFRRENILDVFEKNSEVTCIGKIPSTRRVLAPSAV